MTLPDFIILYRQQFTWNTCEEFNVRFLGTLLLLSTFLTFILYRNFGFADAAA